MLYFYFSTKVGNTRQNCSNEQKLCRVIRQYFIITRFLIFTDIGVI
jgi:IS1 family transposase